VLRTQRGIKPVYGSVGHRIDLDTACRHVLALSPRYRLPETTRRADQLSRRALVE
jgi:deoxyribonuclease V